MGIEVMKPIKVVFGRYGGGKPIVLDAGMYVYLGSARNKALGSRLLRHMRRSGEKRGHDIEGVLREKLREAGLLGMERPGKEKRLHWHVDHLLDREEAVVWLAAAVRTEERLEVALGEWLMGMGETTAFAPGLGASDVRRNTHLMRVDAGPDWWEGLPERMKERFADTI